MRKKIFSFLLTLCIVLAWMPTTMTAYASESHSHCICGASHTAIGNHTDADVKDFTAWTSTDSLPTAAGSYYLTDNVTISSTWKPKNGTVLCLNGKTITCTGDVDAITIASGVSFTLTDCKSGSEMGKITHEPGKNGRGVNMASSVISPSAFTMYGGNITGNKATEGGGGVNVGSYSTFNMYGGSISSNTATGNGGGVNAGTSCTLALYGGSISGNTAALDGDGGGVRLGSTCTFTMSGGSIAGNKATDGGGVYIFSSTFTMEGGSITSNEATKGGGVYIWGTFNMSGGSITGNTALQEGGGVHTWSSYNFTISGNVNISSNNKTTSGETTTDNVYLDLGRKITICGALADTSKIGVNRSWSTSNSSVDITGTNETDYSRNFTSDDTDYEIYYDVNSQIIKIKAKSSEHTEHDWKYSANGAVLTASCDKKAICQEADKTLTISAASPVYSGNAATINIGTTEERTAWEAAGFTLPTVVEHYNGATMLDSAPTTAGTYTAKVTYNGVTASVNYTITDRTPAITTHTITATAGANGSITPSGAVEVNDGTNQAFIITPNEGYEIDTLKVDGSDVTAVKGYTFLDVTVDHTIAVTFKQISQTPNTPDTPTTLVEYKIIEGTDGTHIINVDGSYTIRANGDFSKFVSVEVDGKTVDSSNYTAKSGSTIITFTESYMNSLSIGTHTVKLNYTDGFASAGITVTQKEVGDKSITEPPTGDVHPIGWLFILVLTSSILLAGMTVIKVKKDE